MTVTREFPPSWKTVDLDQYRPTLVDTPAVVLAHDRTKVAGGWADPTSPSLDFLRDRISLEHNGPIFVDDNDRPLNPAGPTGRAGRILGKWGPNLAADPIVLRRGVADSLEMLAIERKDTGAWAIPGGMVDENEDAQTAAARELHEECGAVVDFASAHIIYRGVVAKDPRNTDHAWMETTALALLLAPNIAQTIEPKAGDDARRAKWMTLDDASVENFYADHGTFVRAAVAWANTQP